MISIIFKISIIFTPLEIMHAYVIGTLPDTKSKYTGTKCLVTVEISAKDVNIFDGPVIDKNNATYKVKNFKIVEIIDESKENYTACFLGDLYKNKDLYNLNDDVRSNRPILCYLTKRRALCSIYEYKINNCRYSYSENGSLISKTQY